MSSARNYHCSSLVVVLRSARPPRGDASPVKYSSQRAFTARCRSQRAGSAETRPIVQLECDLLADALLRDRLCQTNFNEGRATGSFP